MDTPVRNMIRQLNVALVNVKVYAADHPTTGAAVQKSFDALTEILQQKGEFALGVVDNTLIVDESPVEESDTLIAKFIEELSIRNIEGLVFYADISLDEFGVFLNCMSREPDGLMAEGGVQKFLENQGVSHVLANEIKYGKIKDSIGDGEGLEEAVIAAFLMGKMPVFRGDQKDFLSLLEENPAKVGEMINTGLETMREKGGGKAELARAANRALEQVGRFLEAQPGGSEKHLNIMTQIVFSMNPEAQAGLYRFRTAQEDYPQDRIDSFVMEFKDEEVIRLICNVYRGGLRSPGVLARVAKRVMSTEERRKRVAPGLGRELMKLGMGKEAWERLRDWILWETYSVGQKVDRLASRVPLDKSDLDRIKHLGPDLTREENGGEIAKLLKSLLATLKSDDPEIRTIVADYLPQFYDIVEASGRFKSVDLFFCQKLIARLKREPEERVRQSILMSLAVILRKQILKDHFHAAARAILTLSKMGYLELLTRRSDSLISRDVSDHLIGALIGEDKTRRDQASIFLRLLGKAVLEPVLFALERPENPDVRKRLMAVVRSMGTEITGEIIHRLADKRWYVIQSALYILGEIGDKAVSPDLLTSSAYHDDIRVRKEAIKTLGKLKSRGAIRILCQLLEDKNEEIRFLVLKTLGDVGDKMAMPHILPLLQKKRLKGQKSEIIRQTAIEVLGRIGDPEAIPTLLDLLKSKGVFRKEDETIRKSVVDALGAIRNPELEEVLQAVIEKDADVAVREAARRALLNLKPPETRATP